jgi:TRAP-type C4-dicarboxylate transport system permease large subunit
MAVNLMVSCRIAGVSMESTIPWVSWLVLAMTAAAAAVMAMPELALGLPRAMGIL